MASELTVLAHMLDRIGESQPEIARLHAEQPPRHAGGSRRLLPGLPHLRRTSRAGRPTTAPRSSAPSSARAAAIRRWTRRIFDFFREVMLPRDPADVPAAGQRAAGAAIRRQTPRTAASAAALRDEVPAVHRAAAGQGPRGHGVLSPQRAALAQRSRRRSVAVRRAGRRVPRAEPAAAAGLALRDDRHVDPRHQARRGRARPHRRPLGDARRVGARGREMDAARTSRRGRSSTASRRPIATTSTASTRRCSAPGREAIADGVLSRGCRPT